MPTVYGSLPTPKAKAARPDACAPSALAKQFRPLKTFDDPLSEPVVSLWQDKDLFYEVTLAPESDEAVAANAAFLSQLPRAQARLLAMRVLHACGQPFHNPNLAAKGATIRRITACLHSFHDEGLIEDSMFTAGSAKQLSSALADGKLFAKADANLLSKAEGFLKDPRIALLDPRHQLQQLVLAYVGRVSDEDRGDGAKFGGELIRTSFLRALPAAFWDCRICRELWAFDSFRRAGARVPDLASWNGVFATSVVRLVSGRGWWNHSAGQGFKGTSNDLQAVKPNSAESFVQAQPGDLVVWSKKCAFQSLLLQFDPKADTLLTVDADASHQAVTVGLRKRSSAEGWICTLDCLSPNQPPMVVEQAFRLPTAQDLQKCVSEPVPAACQVQQSRLDSASKQSNEELQRAATLGNLSRDKKTGDSEQSEAADTDGKKSGENAAASAKSEQDGNGDKKDENITNEGSKKQLRANKAEHSEGTGSGSHARKPSGHRPHRKPKGRSGQQSGLSSGSESGGSRSQAAHRRKRRKSSSSHSESGVRSQSSESTHSSL